MKIWGFSNNEWSSQCWSTNKTLLLYWYCKNLVDRGYNGPQGLQKVELLCIPLLPLSLLVIVKIWGFSNNEWSSQCWSTNKTLLLYWYCKNLVDRGYNGPQGLQKVELLCIPLLPLSLLVIVKSLLASKAESLPLCSSTLTVEKVVLDVPNLEWMGRED